MKVEHYIQETPEKLLGIINSASDLFTEVVKRKIDRIVITGSGTSYHSGVQTQKIIQHFAKIPVDTYYPFMIDNDTFLSKSSTTLVIGISQGGSSKSTYNAMKTAKESGCIVASMAGKSNALIDDVADFILTVNCGEENAGPKTKGYYCTKLNLTLFALQLSKATGKLSEVEYENEINTIKGSISRFSKTYDIALRWVDNNKKKLSEAKEIRLIGTSEIYGGTIEGALKLLETLQIPVTGHEFEEFIHGIYNAINEDSTIIILDTDVEPRVPKMIEVLSQWTKNIYVIGINVNDEPQNMRSDFINHSFYKTYEYIIPIQLICALIPPLKGIDPNEPSDPQFHRKLGSKVIDR